jgi:hypothetical protein
MPIIKHAFTDLSVFSAINPLAHWFICAATLAATGKNGMEIIKWVATATGLYDNRTLTDIYYNAHILLQNSLH